MKFTRILKRITSRLTFFDYLSLALATGLIITLVLFFQRKVEWLEVEFRSARAPYWAAGKISVGDCELDGLGRKVAEVLSVRQFEGGKSWETDLRLKLRLRGVWDRKKKQYLFRSKPLGIGSYLTLNLSQVLIEGYVTNIEGTPDTRFWEDKIVEARLVTLSEVFPETIGVFPWEAEAVKVGDQMKDAQGEIVAEVLEKIVKPAKRIVTSQNGKIFVQSDPVKKDVILKIKLKTTKKGEINYFLEDTKVKIGERFSLHLPAISLYPVITKVLD